ncbi:transglutaminase domain-containing protein [Cohnella sp. CFH 77786]|uniref:transglutaminase-like domain-containing protein n=1 Tax=Cohnella sp. CFH 77786 TaxID=2662265 RepID=UPI001C60D5DC|nr:transglutaminase-like domain-containing protein [Cohnella sp. CFH 77786]MBW5448514.1 transglutaminase domain-containing protein [Cohnella sp. CFH 77786]
MRRRPLALDESAQRLIEEKFAYKRALAAARENDLFGIFGETLTEDEALALKYLYAYMPLNDLADYEGSLFLAHVRQTLQIRNAVPWGDRIPDPLFFHFVLPYRVNNENIEDHRLRLFEDIYPRVQGMSMAEAILETNHWCHEKANYAPNDRRTVSPLTLMRTALGRCGEQSTLAVAALRSIGIPARQVYTPRWAHCDSNHAWVEAWEDGTWHFLGACEPEPRLDRGWFRRPARRAMLVHTRVAADYSGPETVTLARPWYSELNLLHQYADTKVLKIRAVDSNGQPVQANVDIQLYNYAELSTIVPLETDETGGASVTLGLGDTWISAYGSGGWGFAKCSAGETGEVILTLSREWPNDTVMELEMVPPPEQPDVESELVTEEESSVHERRVKQGAQIRADYEATFLGEKDAEALAAECSLPADRVCNALRKARGNSREIAAYLREQSPVYGEWCLRLLEVLNEKDLTDTFRGTLEDHLTFSMMEKGETDDDTFALYLLNPRADFEMLTPYRAFFRRHFGEERLAEYSADPHRLAEFLETEFEIIEDLTFYKGSVTPVGSCRLKKGDQLARDILFVAASRSAGIPARLEPSDRRPQFWRGGAWHDVRFGKSAAAAGPGAGKIETGSVAWVKDEESEEQAKYFLNFTLARFENGAYHTLQYERGESDVFDRPFDVQAGRYRLTTGVRLGDGSAWVCLRFFEVKPGQLASIPLAFRKRPSDFPVIGTANLHACAQSQTGETQPLAGLAGRAGTLLAWIEPDREPSKHLLRELREMKAEWESSGVSIVCLIGEAKWNVSSALFDDRELPSNLWFGKENQAYDTLASVDNTDSPERAKEFPIVYAIDADHRIRYRSSGYKLGISKEAAALFKALAP